MKRKTGKILNRTAGTLAIMSAIYLTASVTGMREKLVQTALANPVVYNELAPIKPEIIQAGNTPFKTIKTSKSSANTNVFVNLENNRYSARIDTGLGFTGLLIGSNLIEKIGIEYRPEVGIWQNITGGICYPKGLSLGDIRIYNPQSAYINQFWQKQIMGVTVSEDKYLSIGLPILSKFSYISFNNRTGALEFSYNRVFSGNYHAFNLYDTQIAFDEHHQKRLFANVPVQGKMLNLKFDTCGGKNLKLSQTTFQRIADDMDIIDTQVSTVTSVQFGQIDCQRVTVKELNIAGTIIKNAVIDVFPDRNYLCDILPLSVLEDKSVVIDFQHKLLLVAK